MPNQIPEIAFLLKEVERKYGREVHTSTDFESLSVVIEREINEYISSATLKRLWGYVSLKPAPRVATLDVLCRFIGHLFRQGFFGLSCSQQLFQRATVNPFHFDAMAKRF